MAKEWPPLRGRKRRLRRPRGPRPPRPKVSRASRPGGWAGLSLGLGLGLGFALARGTQTPPQANEPEPCPAAEATATPSLIVPRTPSLRGPAAPKPPALSQREASGQRTGAALRALAPEVLAPCAPARGDEVRLHFELRVLAAGTVESVRIVNVERPPPSVASCARSRLRSVTLPAFHSPQSSLLFALSVVL